ncbi:hypothetical protein PanWU01x14_321690 [Parasponia andersonii]|uniref:Uncharacterized protein n=1 Tax=Parasponia andersonii TaxID=3476 RepID=A0A2P5AL43_PARAD|nr:hypothetical protein PanWU01x14_321690 [Parasponia andersonii]
MWPYLKRNPRPPQLHCCDLKNPDPQAVPLSNRTRQLATSLPPSSSSEQNPLRLCTSSRIPQRPSGSQQPDSKCPHRFLLPGLKWHLTAYHRWISER